MRERPEGNLRYSHNVIGRGTTESHLQEDVLEDTLEEVISVHLPVTLATVEITCAMKHVVGPGELDCVRSVQRAIAVISRYGTTCRCHQSCHARTGLTST